MNYVLITLFIAFAAWFCLQIYRLRAERDAQRSPACQRYIHTTVTAADINHLLEDQLKEAQQDLWDSEDARLRMRILLTQTANALKGNPEPLMEHDWSDLPKVAAKLVDDQAHLGEFLHTQARRLGVKAEPLGGIAEERMLAAVHRLAAWEATFPDSDPGILFDSFEFIEQRAREAERRLVEIGSGARS